MSDLDWMFQDDVAPDVELETPRALKKPALHYRREARREFANGLKREALNILIPTLPPPDTDLYVISNGFGAELGYKDIPLDFDFGCMLPHIVKLLGNQGCTAYLSTWSMNMPHTLAILEMIDDGRLSALTFFTDRSFRGRKGPIANTMISGLLERKQRYLAFRNHAKILAVSNPAGACCTVTSSANISFQPRHEQYVLTSAPDVYRFFVDQFFEAMCNEQTQSDEG